MFTWIFGLLLAALSAVTAPAPAVIVSDSIPNEPVVLFWWPEQPPAPVVAEPIPAPALATTHVAAASFDGYSPEVLQWQPALEAIAAEYGKDARWVDKMMWVMKYESGGNPSATGDRGYAIGLYQVHSGESIQGRPSAEQLLDPFFNIRFAATALGPVNDNFGAWGEGRLHNGKPFGALGHHPFPR